MNDSQKHDKIENKTHGEEIVLIFLFGFLLVGVFSILYADFRSLTGVNFSLSMPFSTEQEAESPILPAREDDQLRRYSPNVRVDFGPTGDVKMPGVRGNPDTYLHGSMTFHEDEEGNLSAIGFIDEGKAIEFERFLEKRGKTKPIKYLFLHSPGGSVRDALEMARFIRMKEIETVLVEHSYCASSCPLVFSGGIKRTIQHPAALGVHQIFARETAQGTLQQGLASAQSISAEAQNLLVDMGVDPKAWIKAMQTPKDKIYLFTKKEIDDLSWEAE